MPEIVTIEGSVTPSVLLSRGERMTCQMTDHVQRLIERGYVTVVERHHVAPAADVVPVEPVPVEPVPVEPVPVEPVPGEPEKPKPRPKVRPSRDDGPEQLSLIEENVEVFEPGDVAVVDVDTDGD